MYRIRMYNKNEDYRKLVSNDTEQQSLQSYTFRVFVLCISAY